MVGRVLLPISHLMHCPTLTHQRLIKAHGGIEEMVVRCDCHCLFDRDFGRRKKLKRRETITKGTPLATRRTARGTRAENNEQRRPQRARAQPPDVVQLRQSRLSHLTFASVALRISYVQHSTRTVHSGTGRKAGTRGGRRAGRQVGGDTHLLYPCATT